MSQHLRQMDSSQSDDSQRQALGTGLAAKALPRLPRGWSRVCHETGLFLRSIGLGILVTAFQGFFRNSFLEPEKAAIRRSRVTASLRALIHVLPLGLSIFEIILNWKGHYVGDEFDKQNYLQFVAKAHEICIQASLATIALSYIRYQICTGKGMPFGAMLGALQFFQISYLWSVEFWSAIYSKNFQLRKKICFAVLILVCVLITAAAGPSSANLLIAHQGIWPRNSDYFAINATFLDIWPSRLDDKSFPAHCKTLMPSSPEDDCLIPNIYSDWAVGSALGTYDVVDQIIKVDTSRSGYSRDLALGPCFQGYRDQVCSTFPMDIFAYGLVVFAEADLAEAARSLVAYHVLKKDYYQPYTTGICVADTVQNSSDQAALRFPRLSETASEIARGQETFLVPDLRKGQSTYNIPGNSSQFRVGWVDLPHEIFGTGIPGAIIVHPQSSKNLPYNITTCTLNAGWGSSSISVNTDEDDEAGSGMTQIPSSWQIHDEGYMDEGYRQVPRAMPMFQNTSQFSYPQRHINVSKGWMEFINPNIVVSDNSTTNAISIIMSQLEDPPEEKQLAFTLNLFLATALSESGGTYAWDAFGNRSSALAKRKTWSLYEVEKSFYGWEYNAQQTTTKLAIAVMFAYCVLVLGHLIYSAISGVSSTAWDSVAEMIVLAMNSSPTRALQNTCAGIIGRTPFQTTVRVLKTSEKHLELVFGEVQDPNANFSNLVMNEKYGSIAEVREDEDAVLDMEAQGELLGDDLV